MVKILFVRVMAIRRVIASRISGLKKFTGAELPIVSEAPLPAEVEAQESFSPRGLAEEIRRVESIQGFLEIFLRLPSFCWGKASGPEAGRWYTVTFPEPLDSPSVVCVGEVRAGDIITRPLGRVTKTLTEYIDEIYANLPPEWEYIPSPIWGNWRNFFAQAGGRLLYFFQEVLFKRQADRVEERVNQVLRDFYQMTGIPEGMLITPLHTRFVTKTGFEFLSLGNTTAWWIAIGK